MSKPKVLEGRDLPSVANYIKSDNCKNIILMLGAGVSTSAGIPDFRSPETGLYSNLARLNLPYPEAVFDINFFRRNPKPFYTLAQELYPGKYRPTITHSFVRLLAEKSLLHTCFTQNIDTLERRAGVPADKIIEAHGSFASQRCISCRAPYDGDKMKEKILQKQTPKCEKCKVGLVKPDIVFFGESLPIEFMKGRLNMRKADLLIIIGTSLTVYPFAGLAHETRGDCPRVLINIDRVGNIGSQSNDVVLLGKCDEVVIKLCKELGWYEDLMKLWETTEISMTGDESLAEKETKEEELEDTVEKLADKIAASLALNEVLSGVRDKQSENAESIETTVIQPIVPSPKKDVETPESEVTASAGSDSKSSDSGKL